MNLRLFFSTTMIALVTLAYLAGQTGRPGYTLPIYSRRYQVTCDTCHTAAPRLNRFGLAFQANHFHWTGGPPPVYHTGLNALPISGLSTSSSIRDQSAHLTATGFNSLELFASSDFIIGPQRAGGYFADYVAALANGRGGDLGNAFVSLPVAGQTGQFAVTMGQFTPLAYQYDPINSLSQALPAALSGADSFSPISSSPGVRLEFYDRRGKAQPDGTYINLGVPFAGHLALNRDSQLYGSRGVYLHAFRRSRAASYGAYGYTHAGHHLEGLLGTWDIDPKLGLLAIAGSGQDAQGSARRLSLEADYVPSPALALTGRIEAVTGGGQPSDLFPVAALTGYPFHQSVLRVTAETIQSKSNRSTALYAFVQF